MTSGDVDDSMGAQPQGGDDARDVEAALRRALAGPASPAELDGWDVVAAAYRDSAPSLRSRRLRLVAALPLSAATAATLLLPAGAVAAAYTGRLPAHVQHWAHRALAPIGVPAHHAPRSRASTPATPAPVRPRAVPLQVVPRTAATALPEPQHTSAVRLCAVLSRTPNAQQQHVLGALRRLLPREPDLRRTCRTLLVSPPKPDRRPPLSQPSATASTPSDASPSPRPAASPSASPVPSPSPSSAG